MIIFGAGGDLTKRKLIPSLYHLCAAELLPESFAMLGLDRLDLDDDSFRELMADQIDNTSAIVFDKDGLGPAGAADPLHEDRHARRDLTTNIVCERLSPHRRRARTPKATISFTWPSRRACSAT